ncbi:Siderophore-interacting protein [Oceanicola granulosus HTCC2516]|uniref:Siderophore-interacting protein n=1 Tax=Oceanicola granulosus (strain ATCC BAA-861 / DSM 15982 / KCTC 12143 / HTCC2516) TaxID=314256 RepID=Q2CA37_OCEGH|nr:siderophore-interacting protein [Oceanicola granulosus]EAR49528.1 Siderophore-interacting protein [Oceanicola granulosus HTCC2516]
MPITVNRVRHEMRYRRITVTAAERITPKMARITFASGELEGFASPGFDDHVRLFFPRPGAALPVPEVGARGLDWPDPAPEHRDYTPRFYDPDTLELTVDFVLHDHGVASDWAAAARPGDEIGLAGPRGSFLLEGEADWQLLIGDATALPAIARRLEELPADSWAMAVIEVASAAEEQPLDSRAIVATTWLHADAGEGLADHLETLELPKGEGFVFCAAEAEVVAQARARLAALGLPESHLRAANYWRRAQH